MMTRPLHRKDSVLQLLSMSLARVGSCIVLVMPLTSSESTLPLSRFPGKFGLGRSFHLNGDGFRQALKLSLQTNNDMRQLVGEAPTNDIVLVTLHKMKHRHACLGA